VPVAAIRSRLKKKIAMFVALVIIPLLATLLWLFSIRPYCRRNGKGFTAGACLGAPFWVDWQVAGELAKTKGDGGMIFICRLVFGLHIVGFCVFLFAIFSC
jgi:hypothetical protein